MAVSTHQKRPTFITFYDVQKAYDNVDNEDLLTMIWDKGLRGKTWRILKNLNTELSATINTRFGETRPFHIELGGKQGSRLTGRMFSKLMDLLAEDLEISEEGFKLIEKFVIGALLWVDDVTTFADGKDDQKKMLEKIHEFGKKHKLVWGKDKCQIMPIGKHKEKEMEWKLGEMNVKETKKYKYLGDVLTNDGKNKENLTARKQKLQATTVSIHTIASSEVLNRVETAVLLELHEKISITSLLNNSESWNLNKGEQDEIETIEIQALKDLFDLPLHTPNAAIVFTFGTLFTKQRIHKKQLLYLHKILSQKDEHWTQKTLRLLEELNIGWGKHIKDLLKDYNLPIEFNTVKNTHPREWRNKVVTAIEKKNQERLYEECHKKIDESVIAKTKTKSLINKLTDASYKRQVSLEITNATKQETKTMISARFGMLECGQNFKGTLSLLCNQCNCIDNEEHRLNFCVKWRDVNLYDNVEKVDMNTIYSNDINELRPVISKIELVWNTRTAHGTMNVL